MDDYQAPIIYVKIIKDYVNKYHGDCLASLLVVSKRDLLNYFSKRVKIGKYYRMRVAGELKSFGLVRFNGGRFLVIDRSEVEKNI